MSDDQDKKPTVTRKPKPKFQCVDYRNTKIPQFPSSAKMAEQNLTNYLNDQANDGWVFQSIMSYAVGAETNRKMLIFRKN